MAEVQISRNSKLLGENAFNYGKRHSRKQTTFSIQNLKGIQVGKTAKPQNVNTSNNQQNKYYLRLDSPYTNKAMVSIGLNYEDFQPRTLEDFGDPNIDQEVQQIRYEHYLRTIASDISAVLSKRKELLEADMKRKGNQTRSQDQSKIEPDQVMSKQNSKMNIQLHPLSTKRSLNKLGQNRYKPSQMTQSQTYNGDNFKGLLKTTQSTLNLNHKTPQQLNLKQLEQEIEFDDNYSKEVVGKELEKYNKKKTQKQLFAKQDYDLEVQRFKELLRIKEREEKNEENRIRQEIEKFQIKQKRQEEAQNMRENIEKVEKDRKKLMKEQRKQLKEKFDKQAKINQSIAQAKQQEIELKRRQRQEANYKIQAYLINKQEQEEYEQEQLIYDISNKLNQADQNHKLKQQELIEQKQYQNFVDQQKAIRSTQYKAAKEHNQLQDTVAKMEKKEKDFQDRQVDVIMQETQKINNNIAMRTRFEDQVRLNRQNQKQTQSQFQQRLENAQKKIREKQQRDERLQYIKDEKKRLMEETRAKKKIQIAKQQEYIKNNILNKELQRQQQIDYFKQQREFAQEAKRITNKELQQEEQRIFTNLQQAEKHLFPWRSYQTPKNQIYLDKQEKQKGLNLLKSVIEVNQVETRVFDAPEIPKEKDEPK